MACRRVHGTDDAVIYERVGASAGDGGASDCCRVALFAARFYGAACLRAVEAAVAITARDCSCLLLQQRFGEAVAVVVAVDAIM